MASWIIPALKAVLPHVKTIYDTAAPVFTASGDPVYDAPTFGDWIWGTEAIETDEWTSGWQTTGVRDAALQRILAAEKTKEQEASPVA